MHSHASKCSLKHKHQCSSGEIEASGMVHFKRVHLNPERATTEMIMAEITTVIN